MARNLLIFTFRRSFNATIADNSFKVSEEDLNEAIKLAMTDYSSSKSIESLKLLLRWPKGMQYALPHNVNNDFDRVN